MELFRVRINCVDHYQATPTEFDPQLFGENGSPQKAPLKLPVIRVFGATETGQKVCAHVHGALPYLFIDYQGGLTPEEGQESLSTRACIFLIDCSGRLHPSPSSFYRSCSRRQL